MAMTLDDRIKIQDPATYNKIQRLKAQYNNALSNNNRAGMDAAHREAERLRQQFSAKQNISSSKSSSGSSNSSNGSSSSNSKSSSTVKIVNPGYNSQLSNQQDAQIKAQDYGAWTQIQKYKSDYNNAVARGDVKSARAANNAAQQLRQRVLSSSSSSKSSSGGSQAGTADAVSILNDILARNNPLYAPFAAWSQNAFSGSTGSGGTAGGSNQTSNNKTSSSRQTSNNKTSGSSQSGGGQSGASGFWSYLPSSPGRHSNAETASGQYLNLTPQQVINQSGQQQFGFTPVAGSSKGSGGTAGGSNTPASVTNQEKGNRQVNYNGWSDAQKDAFIRSNDLLTWERIERQKAAINNTDNIGNKHEALNILDELRADALYRLLGPSVDTNAAPQYSLSTYDSQRSREQDADIKVKNKNAWEEIQSWKAVYDKAVAKGDAKTALLANKEAEAIRRSVLGGTVVTPDNIESLANAVAAKEKDIIEFERQYSKYLSNPYHLGQNPALYNQWRSLYEQYENSAKLLAAQYQQLSGQTEQETLEAINKKLLDELDKKQEYLDELEKKHSRISISAVGAKDSRRFSDVRAEMAALDNQIYDLEWYIGYNNQRIQNLVDLRQLRLAPNYDQLVAEGKKSRQNYLNQSLRPNENRIYFGRVGNQQANEYGKGKNLLDYIGDEEASDYYAFLAAGMDDAAELELDRLIGNAAMQRAEELLAQGDFNTWDTTLMSFVGGVEQFADGIKQVFTGKIDYTPSVNQIVLSEIAPTLEGIQKVLGDVAQAIGYMAPALLGSTALGAAGMPLLLAQGMASAAIGVASGANSYKDALANGYSPSAAKDYGIINGVLEGGLQFALGGINKIGGVAWEALGKTAGVRNAFKKINNVAKALSGTEAVRTVMKAMQPVGRYAGKMGAEGFEEWLQAVADPIIRNNLFDENNDISPFSEEKLYQALLGAMTAGLANIGSVQSGQGVLNGSDINGNLPSQLRRAFVDGEWRFLLPRANAGDSGAVFRALHRRDDATTNEVNDYINDAIAYGEGTGPRPQEYVPIGRLSNSLIDKIKSFIGKDLTGYRHVLRDNDIRHLLKSPGVTKKDIARIPDIVAAPDIVFHGKNTPTHPDAPLLSDNPTIYYVKRHNGVTYYVEQVIEEGGILSPKQMKLVPTGTVPKFVKKLPMEPAAKEELIRQIKGLEVIPDPDVPANAVPREHALDAPGTYSSPNATIAQAQMNSNREIPRRMLVDGQWRTVLPRAGEIAQRGAGTQQPGEARTGLAAESSSAMQPQLTHALEKRLSELGSKLGRKVVFLDEADFIRQLGEQADGLYHNGTLYINRDSEHPALMVFAHELTHSIKKSQAYDAFRNYVVNSPIFQQDLTQRGQTLEAMVADKLRSYNERGVAMDRSQAEEEVLANYAATRLFTDMDTIEELANANPSLARRIIEAISNMLKAITGKDSAEARFLRQARSRYQQALKDRPSNQTSYMFAGKKALQANHSLLEQAKQMLADGYLPQQIWQQTGWMQDNKNDWKFEIDDSQVQLKDGAALWQAYLATMGRNGQRGALKLGDVLEAKELFANYPQLAEIEVGFDATGEEYVGGYWDAPSNSIQLNMDYAQRPDNALTTLIHEIQHAVQNMENFAVGGNEVLGAYISFMEAAQQLEGEGKLIRNPNQAQEQQNLAAINERLRQNLGVDSISQVGRAGYRLLGGEVEARASQDRQNLTAGERRSNFPEEVFDVAPGYAIRANEYNVPIQMIRGYMKRYLPTVDFADYFTILEGGQQNG